LVKAFLKKWWVEFDFKAPNLPLSLRLKGSNLTMKTTTGNYNIFSRSITSTDMQEPSGIERRDMAITNNTPRDTLWTHGCPTEDHQIRSGN